MGANSEHQGPEAWWLGLEPASRELEPGWTLYSWDRTWANMSGSGQGESAEIIKNLLVVQIMEWLVSSHYHLWKASQPTLK